MLTLVEKLPFAEWLLNTGPGALVLFLLAGLLGWLLAQLIFILLRPMCRRYGKGVYDVVKPLRQPVIMLLVLILVQWVLEIKGWSGSITRQIMQLAFIYGVSWLLIGGTIMLRKLFLLRLNTDEEEDFKARKIYTQIQVLERVVIVAIIVIALGIGITTFTEVRQLGISILSSAGLLGIILGMAAQKIIGNVLAGLQIAISQPIRINDVVVMEGQWGHIEEITLPYVVVRIWDKRRLIVPSSHIIDRPFTNWTRNSADLLGTVFLYMDYSVPVQAIRDKWTEWVEAHPLWDGVAHNVLVTSADANVIEVRLMLSAANSSHRWTMRTGLREKMINWLQEEYPESLPKSRVSLEGPREAEGGAAMKL